MHSRLPNEDREAAEEEPEQHKLRILFEVVTRSRLRSEGSGFTNRTVVKEAQDELGGQSHVDGDSD